MMPCLVKSEWTLRLVCKNWSPIFRLPEVCAGLILARAVLTPGQSRAGMLALLVFGGLSFAASSLKSAGVGLLVYLPWGGFIVPLVIFFMSGLISPAFRAVKPGWFRLLGLASFPFFLFHAAPLIAISHRFGNHPLIWALYFVACWVFALGLTLVITHGKTWIKKAVHHAKV
jgi:peptidoglycan/LPS O-acetylase OafA/YrhL